MATGSKISVHNEIPVRHRRHVQLLLEPYEESVLRSELSPQGRKDRCFSFRRSSSSCSLVLNALVTDLDQIKCHDQNLLTVLVFYLCCNYETTRAKTKSKCRTIHLCAGMHSKVSPLFLALLFSLSLSLSVLCASLSFDLNPFSFFLFFFKTNSNFFPQNRHSFWNFRFGHVKSGIVTTLSAFRKGLVGKRIGDAQIVDSQATGVFNWLKLWWFLERLTIMLCSLFQNRCTSNIERVNAIIAAIYSCSYLLSNPAKGRNSISILHVPLSLLMRLNMANWSYNVMKVF